MATDVKVLESDFRCPFELVMKARGLPDQAFESILNVGICVGEPVRRRGASIFCESPRWNDGGPTRGELGAGWVELSELPNPAV
jgi:hypothetical protein